MKISFFAVSDSGALDVGTNRLSVFNVQEEINAVAFPIFLPSLTLTMLIEREESESSTSTIQIIANLNGQPVFNIPFQVDFQGHLRSRAIGQLQGVPLIAPGDLDIQVSEGSTVMTQWAIKVNLVGEPQLQSRQSVGAVATIAAKSTSGSVSSARQSKTKTKRRKSA